jgi:hypothetical protein
VLAPASVVTLSAESHGTYDLILLSDGSGSPHTTDFSVSNIYKFSPYLTGYTILFDVSDQSLFIVRTIRNT